MLRGRPDIRLPRSYETSPDNFCLPPKTKSLPVAREKADSGASLAFLCHPNSPKAIQLMGL